MFLWACTKRMILIIIFIQPPKLIRPIKRVGFLLSASNNDSHSQNIPTPWLKLFAFELAAKFSKQGENLVPSTFVQRVKRNFQTAHNGGFPSLAIFASQLKRNQLHMHGI
jgi:hypothetical protein